MALGMDRRIQLTPCVSIITLIAMVASETAYGTKFHETNNGRKKKRNDPSYPTVHDHQCG